MSTSAREQVLAQIRQSLGHTGSAPLQPLAGTGPRPAYDGDVVDHFIAKMREKAATVEPLVSLAEVGAAVQRFLAQVLAPPRLRAARALPAIAWPSELRIEHGAARREDTSSITPCFAALAESGGIVTLSGPDTPSTLNFVPDNHIVLVFTAQVQRHLEDVWAMWRATRRPMPRTLNIISGPSRTADIEQTIQLGAHGPRRLHILLIQS